MKKSLIALAALAASGVALAQVTLSGGLGVAFEKNGASDAQLTKGDGNATNLTFTGTEDLGGGLSAGFRLNTRIDGMTGRNDNTDSRLVQNAQISVGGGFGRIAFGREGMASAAGFDAFGAYGSAGNYGWSGAVGFRNDRTMWYTTPSISGFTAIVGMTANNDNAINEGTYFRASYAMGPIALTIAQEKHPSAAGAKGATDKEFAFSYDLKVARVMAVSGKDGAAGSKTTVGVRVPMAAITLKAAYQNATNNVAAIGADYALSKRTRAYADLGKASNAKANYRIGLAHSF